MSPLVRRADPPKYPTPRGRKTPYPKSLRRAALAAATASCMVLVVLAHAGDQQEEQLSGVHEQFLQRLQREPLPGERVLRSGVARVDTQRRLRLDGPPGGGNEIILMCRGTGYLNIVTHPPQPIGAPARRCSKSALIRIRTDQAATIEVRPTAANGDVQWAIASSSSSCAMRAHEDEGGT